MPSEQHRSVWPRANHAWLVNNMYEDEAPIYSKSELTLVPWENLPFDEARRLLLLDIFG